MTTRRRRRGFAPVGSLPVELLGLPKKRTREMALTRAFAEVAGEAVSTRTRALRLVRGVLEVDVEDGPWAETLRQLLPTLARRLSDSHPAWGVRKCRLRRAGRAEEESPQDLAPSEGTESHAAPPRGAPTRRVRTSSAKQGDYRERLSDIARRYLARQ